MKGRESGNSKLVAYFRNLSAQLVLEKGRDLGCEREASLLISIENQPIIWIAVLHRPSLIHNQKIAVVLLILNDLLF
jgi:hypothetical protein